jgi:hypothetical protein
MLDSGASTNVMSLEGHESIGIENHKTLQGIYVQWILEKLKCGLIKEITC